MPSTATPAAANEEVNRLTAEIAANEKLSLSEARLRVFERHPDLVRAAQAYPNRLNDR
jgi:hypothetical protein